MVIVSTPCILMTLIYYHTSIVLFYFVLFRSHTCSTPFPYTTLFRSPDYADAHFNLAGALARAERGQEAIEHWQRYLELDAGSPWARIARAHLELVEPPDQSQSE